MIAALVLGDADAQKEINPLTPEELIKQIEQQDRILAEQKRQIEDQERRLREYREALQRILAKEKLPPKILDSRRGTGAGASSGAPASPASAKSEVPQQAREDGTGGAVRAQTEAQQAQPTPETPAGQPPESATRPPEVAPLSELQSVLTPRGKFVFEPSLEFSTTSSDRVALVGFTIIPGITIGLIDIRGVQRDFFGGVLTGRYGLTSRSEIEVRVPYIYRSESTTARPLATGSVADEVFDVNGSGLGDIELNGRYQFNVGGPNMPFFIGSLRFKTTTGKGPFDVGTTTPIAGLIIPTELPTGTGFYALQPGITALFPTDPAVLFASLTYTWNIEKSINKPDAVGNLIETYDPGDGVGLQFGMGLAINERASFSIGFQYNTFFGDKVNGQSIPNQTQHFYIGQLQFGFSYQLTKSTNFNVTVGAGVTEEAPGVTVTFRLPIMF